MTCQQPNEFRQSSFLSVEFTDEAKFYYDYVFIPLEFIDSISGDSTCVSVHIWNRCCLIRCSLVFGLEPIFLHPQVYESKQDTEFDGKMALDRFQLRRTAYLVNRSANHIKRRNLVSSKFVNAFVGDIDFWLYKSSIYALIWILIGRHIAPPSSAIFTHGSISACACCGGSRR